MGLSIFLFVNTGTSPSVCVCVPPMCPASNVLPCISLTETKTTPVHLRVARPRDMPHDPCPHCCFPPNVAINGFFVSNSPSPYQLDIAPSWTNSAFLDEPATPPATPVHRVFTASVRFPPFKVSLARTLFSSVAVNIRVPPPTPIPYW